VKRGQLRGFYLNQIVTADEDDFSRMTNAELEVFVRDGVAGCRT